MVKWLSLTDYHSPINNYQLPIKRLPVKNKLLKKYSAMSALSFHPSQADFIRSGQDSRSKPQPVF
jgi:hypothetical protein